jgi:hypothetical protein
VSDGKGGHRVHRNDARMHQFCTGEGAARAPIAMIRYDELQAD